MAKAKVQPKTPEQRRDDLQAQLIVFNDERHRLAALKDQQVKVLAGTADRLDLLDKQIEAAKTELDGLGTPQA